jgi:hypothetical protein
LEESLSFDYLIQKTNGIRTLRNVGNYVSKFTLEQAMKAQRGSRGIVLFLL